MTRTLLIDGDTFVFAAASANEYEAQWSDWMWTLHADLNAGIAHLDAAIEAVVDGLKPDKVVVALTDTTNWRKTVMPSYKHARVKKRKPVIYAPLREYVHEKYTTFLRPGLEGDDVLGILSTHPTIFPGERIIVSIDKDMQTIPGTLLNHGQARAGMDIETSATYEDSLRVVTEAEADLYHLTQTLTGDTTDGYPGCPGVGKVGAEKLLAPFVTDEGFDVERAWREAVLPAYAKKGLGEQVALQNAQVARICRWYDYDMDNKEVIPWQPGN